MNVILIPNQLVCHGLIWKKTWVLRVRRNMPLRIPGKRGMGI